MRVLTNPAVDSLSKPSHYCTVLRYRPYKAACRGRKASCGEVLLAWVARPHAPHAKILVTHCRFINNLQMAEAKQWLWVRSRGESHTVRSLPTRAVQLPSAALPATLSSQRSRLLRPVRGRLCPASAAAARTQCTAEGELTRAPLLVPRLLETDMETQKI